MAFHNRSKQVLLKEIRVSQAIQIFSMGQFFIDFFPFLIPKKPPEVSDFTDQNQQQFFLQQQQLQQQQQQQQQPYPPNNRGPQFPIENDYNQENATPLEKSDLKFIQLQNATPYNPNPVNPSMVNSPMMNVGNNDYESHLDLTPEKKKIQVESFVYNNSDNQSKQKIQKDQLSSLYGNENKEIAKAMDKNAQLGMVKEINQIETSGPFALPTKMLPSFNNDINDYNQKGNNYGRPPSQPRLSIIERNKVFNIAEFYNNPKIMLITLSKLYKLDLFKETQLYKQLQDLERQGIQLSAKQKQLVSREEHIYNILSQRRMEYLEYMDFLIPYLVLFHRQIKDEVLQQHQKVGQKIYRAVLLRARAEQEQYFLMKHGEDYQWNTDLFNEEQKKKIFEDAMLGLLVFANQQNTQQRNNLDISKEVLQQLEKLENQQIIRLRGGDRIFERWCLIYGFTLYIYMNAGKNSLESQIRMPLLFNATENEKHPESFILKSEDNTIQMEVMMDRDVKTQDWYMDLVKQITFKQYYFILGRSGNLPDQKLVNFFNGMEIEKVDLQLDTQEEDFSDQETFFPPQNQYFKDIVINFCLNLFFLLKYCSSLRILKLAGQRWPEFLMYDIMMQLYQPISRTQIEVLVLDGNEIGSAFLGKLAEYLCNIASENLWLLSLNNIMLKDNGIQVLSQALVSRHMFLKNISQQNKQKQLYTLLPLLKLGLRNVMMTDLGVFNICQALDKINQFNGRGGIEVEYPKKLSLDISQNDITENSLRHIGGILSKFNGLIYLNLSKSYRMNALYSEYFFDSLIVINGKENYSLEVLDLSCVKINEKFFEGVMKFLANTCTLQAIIISYNESFDEYLSNYHDKALLRLLRIQQGSQNSEIYTFSQTY